MDPARPMLYCLSLSLKRVLPDLTVSTSSRRSPSILSSTYQTPLPSGSANDRCGCRTSLFDLQMFQTMALSDPNFADRLASKPRISPDAVSMVENELSGASDLQHSTYETFFDKRSTSKKHQGGTRSSPLHKGKETTQKLPLRPGSPLGSN